MSRGSSRANTPRSRSRALLVSVTRWDQRTAWAMSAAPVAGLVPAPPPGLPRRSRIGDPAVFFDRWLTSTTPPLADPEWQYRVYGRHHHRFALSPFPFPL